MADGEYFGTADQRRMQARAAMTWRLVGDDPRFGCHGRAVALSDPEGGTIDLQVALARLNGAAAIEGVPTGEATAWRAALEAAGMTTDAYVEWTGDAAAFAAAERIAAERRLPEDLTLRWVDADTPEETMSALDALTQSCGVLLPMGAFLRGVARPAACVAAFDGAGVAVGASAGVAQFHPRHPRGRCAWWGMLSTAPARRGEGIALLLGALSMLALRDRCGMAEVFTGIRVGNAASETLCRRLGLAPTETEVVVAMDPSAFAGDRVTG